MLEFWRRDVDQCNVVVSIRMSLNFSSFSFYFRTEKMISPLPHSSSSSSSTTSSPLTHQTINKNNNNNARSFNSNNNKFYRPLSGSSAPSWTTTRSASSPLLMRPPTLDKYCAATPVAASNDAQQKTDNKNVSIFLSFSFVWLIDWLKAN